MLGSLILNGRQESADRKEVCISALRIKAIFLSSTQRQSDFYRYQFPCFSGVICYSNPKCFLYLSIMAGHCHSPHEQYNALVILCFMVVSNKPTISLRHPPDSGVTICGVISVIETLSAQEAKQSDDQIYREIEGSIISPLLLTYTSGAKPKSPHRLVRQQ